MVLGTTAKTGFWRINPDTGNREWIEQSNQPKKPKLEEEIVEAPEVPAVRDTGPLVSSMELFELDKTWADWWNQYSRTGSYPDTPEDATLKPLFDQWLQSVKAFEVESPPVEPVALPEAPEIEVGETARLYDIPEASFVTSEQLASLSLPSEERPTTDQAPFVQYLTSEQARFLGFDVKEGAVVKVTPMTEGEPQFTLVLEPEAAVELVAPTLLPQLEEALRSTYAYMFDPANTFNVTLEEIPINAVRALQASMQRDYAGFVKDLFERAGPLKGEYILRQLGVTEEFVLQTMDFKEQEARVITLIKEVMPDVDTVEAFQKIVEADFSLFLETMQTGGSSDEKTKLLEVMGYNPAEIEQVFSRQVMVAEVDGIRQQITVDVETRSAFDVNGDFIGTYNPTTKQFTKAPPKNIFENAWDFLAFASKGYWEEGQNTFLSVIPELIFADIPIKEEDRTLAEKFFGTDMVRVINEDNRKRREHFRQLYAENLEEHAVWQKKHPDMVPPIAFQEGAYKNPEVLKDFRYYVYELANITPFIVAATGVALATGGLGLPALLGTAALMAPIEAHGVYQELVRAGAPRDKAAQLSAVAGIVIGLLESAGRIPLLKQVSPFLFGKFKKEVGAQLAKRGTREAIKRFGRAYTVTQFSEIITEVAQEVVSNAAISVYDENKSLLENLPDIAVKTAVATIVPGVAGGAASVRMIGRNEQTGLTDLAKKAKGWVKDNKGNWYDTIKGEEGFVRLPGEPEEVAPEVIQKSWFRGTISKELGGDTFWSASESVAGDFGTAKVGEQATVRKLTPEEMPKNPFIVEGGKQELADTLKIKFDPFTQGHEFDAEVKRIFQSQGFDSVYYPEGTLGAEELHIFAKPPVVPEVAPEVTETTQRLQAVEDEITNINTSIAANEADLAQLREAQAPAFEISSKEETIRNLKSTLVLTEKQKAQLERRVGIKPVVAPEIPVTEPGMPEAGLQPSMLPEEVAAKEVRPRPRAEIVQISMDDQLKLETVKRNAALEKIEKKIRKADKTLATKGKLPEGQGTRAELELERARLEARRDLAQIDTLAQLQRSREEIETEIGNRRLPFHGRAKSGPYVGWTSKQLDAMWAEYNKAEAKLFKSAGADTTKPLIALPTPTTEEIDIAQDSPSGKALTRKQVKRTLDLFANYIESRAVLDAFELTKELMRVTRSGRVEKLKARVQELIIQGMPKEQAIRQSIQETMRGPLPKATTDFVSDLTEQMRDVLFNKVYQVLKEDGFELMSTVTALTNALDGKPIPRTLGRKGGSAWTRLQRVFGDQPKVLKALDKMAKEKEPLDDIAEGIFHEIGRPHTPVDRETADYLMGLSDEATQLEVQGLYREETTGELKLLPQHPTIFNRPIDLIVSDLRTSADIEFALADLELTRQLSEGEITFEEFELKRLEARDKAYPSTPVTKYDAPIDKAFKQPPMFNFMERSLFNRVLKEIGMAPLDIGNFLRANKASFDQSFLRQSKLLLSGHPILAWQSHATAWQSMFSQKHTEAEWELITRDPDFQIYDQIRVDTGHDPLRVPAFAATKGTEQYRTSEEFGFTRQDVERAIPRFTAWLPHVKYSERGFSAGTNKVVWGVWKQKLAFAKRYSEKIASGEVVLKEGEAFDIIQEMTDEQSMLGDLIQRANLRRFSGMAPAMNAFFFAARSKIGRLLLPKHLIGMTIRDGKVGFNSRVMKEAWKDFFLWNSYISGIMFLGNWLDLWDLEKDPRSAEFMSARIGKTRIDPWAGYRQFVVLYARLVTGTGISSVTGTEYDVNKLGALNSFVINSLSPLASTLLEFWTGRNFLGQVIDYDDARYWIEKITPFAINDIWEAAEEDWRLGIAVTIPAVYGEGVQTYTGDWEDNWTKLGISKYIENTAYGIMEPYDDTADFWADTAKQFDTENLADLTAAKGFPDYIRAIVQAKIFKEHLNTLPTDTLVSLNADLALDEPTFSEYHQMWADRQKLVAAGDDAELTRQELQPDKKYKSVTYKGKDALTAFDKKNPGAEKGNFSQRQFALLTEYWAITDEKKQVEFLKEHKSEIGVKARDEWLRSHPKENAQLAVWGQAKILSREAFSEFNRLTSELNIPDQALPELTVPPETSWDTHIAYEEMVSEGTHPSVEAQLLLLKDHLAAEETGVKSYVQWRADNKKPLELSDKPLEYLQLRVDNADLYDKLEEAGEIAVKAEREAAREAVRATQVGDQTFHDVERRVDAMGKGTREAPIPEETVTAYVEHMRIVDETSGNSSRAKLNRYDNDDLNEFLMNEDYHGESPTEALDEDQAYLDNYLVPRWRIDVEYEVEDTEFNAIPGTDEEGRAAYLAGEGLEGNDLARRVEYRQNRHRYDALSLTSVKITFKGIILQDTSLSIKDRHSAFEDQSVSGIALTDVEITELASGYNMTEAALDLARNITWTDIPAGEGEGVWEEGGAWVEATNKIFIPADKVRQEQMSAVVVHEVAHWSWFQLVKSEQQKYKQTFMALVKTNDTINQLFSTVAGETKVPETGDIGFDVMFSEIYSQVISLLNQDEIPNRLLSSYHPMTTGFLEKGQERFPLDQLENYVSYYEMAIKGQRQERFLVENGGEDPENLTGFALTMHNFANNGKGIDIPRPEDVPDVEFDNISEEWAEEITKFTGFADSELEHYIEFPEAGLTLDETRQKARDAMLFTIETQTYSGVRVKNNQLTAFGMAYYRREAFASFVPENFTEDYVGWKKIQAEGKPADWALQTGQTGAGLWYEDDWFMWEHPEFRKNIYMNPRHNNGIQRDKWDFTTVPTREVFDKYLTHIALPHQFAKDQDRLANPDLDAWGVIKLRWVPALEKKRREARTAFERLSESFSERDLRIQERLRKLRE